MAQLGRALDLGSRGRRFEPGYPDLRASGTEIPFQVHTLRDTGFDSQAPLLLGETFQGKHKVETSPLGSDAEVESTNYTTRWFREPGCTVMALCRIPLKEEK